MNWRHKQYLEKYKKQNKMKAYAQYTKPTTTSINVNQSYQGERIEEKIQRIVSNKEPISDTAPLVYTERKDGVQPEYDIRTDRFEVAVDAMDKVTQSHQAKRENRIGQKAMQGMTEEQKAEYVKDKPNVQYTPQKPQGGTTESSQ